MVCGMSATGPLPADAGFFSQHPVRTGHTPPDKGLIVMEIVLFIVFLVLLAAASAAGLTADSRDGSDWAPTVDGRRAPRRR